MRFAAWIAATSEYEAVCTPGLRMADGSAARFEDFFGSDARMRSSRRSFWGEWFCPPVPGGGVGVGVVRSGGGVGGGYMGRGERWVEWRDGDAGGRGESRFLRG